MARGVVMGGHGLGFAAEPQQDQTGQDADERETSDIQMPEIADEVTHFDSFVFWG
jgi:hypothetical protein